MNRYATLAVNALIMIAFAGMSSVMMAPIINRAMGYPSETYSLSAIPLLTHALMTRMWLTWMIPLIWILITLGMILTKKTEQQHISLHTSATILVGLVLLSVFAIAGIIPFVPVICHLSP